MTSGRSSVSPVGSPEPIAALNRVRIAELAQLWEAREPLVDIRAYCPGVVCNEGICPYLRLRVADMLNRAQASLPPGYKLKVGTALRTPSMQRHGWDNYFQKMRDEHPDWPLSALRRATNKYHAPYDQKAPPGHCTGGAVDVGLLDPEGNALDMVAPTQGWEAVDTFTTKISPESRANRMLMVEAMLGAGFSNCRDEYWHYSWGDSGWAVRVGESECPYGWTYAPPILAVTEEAQNAPEQLLDTQRNAQGKPVSVTGTCLWPQSAPHFEARLLWAKHTPTLLRVVYKRLTIPVTFYVGNGDSAWEPVTDIRQGEETWVLNLTPPFDRTILTTQLPPPKPADTPDNGAAA